MCQTSHVKARHTQGEAKSLLIICRSEGICQYIFAERIRSGISKVRNEYRERMSLLTSLPGGVYTTMQADTADKPRRAKIHVASHEGRPSTDFQVCRKAVKIIAQK